LNGNHTILYNAVSDGLLIFRNQGSTTNIMALSGSGQVGIGTTAPASSWGWAKFLQIDNATNAALILTDRAGSTQENSIVTDGAGLYIDSAGHGTAANNKIIFRTEETNSQYSSTERMRIHSSGAITFGSDTTTLDFTPGVVVNGTTPALGLRAEVAIVKKLLASALNPKAGVVPLTTTPGVKSKVVVSEPKVIAPDE
jgi:hypothetical protein